MNIQNFIEEMDGRFKDGAFDDMATLFSDDWAALRAEIERLQRAESLLTIQERRIVIMRDYLIGLDTSKAVDIVRLADAELM